MKSNQVHAKGATAGVRQPANNPRWSTRQDKVFVYDADAARGHGCCSCVLGFLSPRAVLVRPAHVDEPYDAVPVRPAHVDEPQDNELDVSKHIKGEPALEPAPRVDSQSVMSQSLTKVVMQIRGADSRLIKESTVDRTQRLITFDELEKPMKELGSGEFCVALLSKLDGKDVVVKMLKPLQRSNPTASQDLLSESALMMAMQHPHVLGAIAHGLDPDGLPFIVIEKLETVLSAELPRPADSVPFWTRRSEVKKWPLTRALHTGLELAEALHYCHTEVATSVFPGCRILHRDLKPNNIGFLPDGRLALFDFGLAKLWRISADDLDGNETRKLTGNTGSLRYMAPEVALAKPYSHKAEVFAFATVLWEMASHERPFADYDVKGFYKCAATPRLPPRFCRIRREFLEPTSLTSA